MGTALLELRLFGKPAVWVEGVEITPALPKKGVLLLALLALRGGKPVDRTQLASLLWMEAPEAAGLHSLRQMLAKVRTELGAARVALHAPAARTLSLDLTQDVTVDVLDFDAAYASPDREGRERAVALYREPLLAGCNEPFAVMDREVRHDAFLAAAHSLARDYLASEQFPQATAMLRRLLTEDPYDEAACRSLVSALASSGQWPAALEEYREFRARFRRELRADVSAETKELARSIRKQETDGSVRAVKKLSMPAPLSDLIGRTRAIAEVESLLQLCRLVTLLGPGGVGKTSLALSVARHTEGQHLDGATFVDLSALRDGAAIPFAIASALEAPEETGRTRLESLVRHLSEREILLVVDNCEHLTKEVAPLLERLLLSSPGLRVLATSRQTLGVRGEQVWNVPVLPTPSANQSPEEIAKSEAVRLFLARSRRSSAEIGEKELSAVGSICRRLDGLPLALELAAARTNIFSPSEIERRLDDRFSLLTTGAGQLEKHQTLHACMGWSWDLLSSDERELLMAMATFRGGSTLEAIQAVAPPGVGEAEAVLGSLIDKSLVTAQGPGVPTRYGMLETIREFAEERLRESGRWPGVNERHRDYFLAQVEESYHPMNSVEEARKFAAFEQEHDNHIAAIEWSHRQKERAKAIRMCAALSRFWDTCGHLNEGRAQLELALSHPAPGLSEETLSRAYVHLGWMSSVQGECESAIDCYEKALGIAKKLGDRSAVAVILTCVANAYLLGNQLENAKAALLEALGIVRETEPNGGAMILCNLAEVAFCQDNLAEAEEWLKATEQSLGEISSERATTSGTYLRHMAYFAHRKGDFLAAREYALRSLKLFEKAGLLVEIPYAQLTLALAERGLGNECRAAELKNEAERALTSDNLKCPNYLICEGISRR